MKCVHIIHNAGNNLDKCSHTNNNSGNNLGKVVPISFTILGITWEMCPYYSQFREQLG